MHMAAEAGHVEVVKLLVESGASPRAESLVSQHIIFFRHLKPCYMTLFPTGRRNMSVKASLYATGFWATCVAKKGHKLEVSRRFVRSCCVFWQDLLFRSQRLLMISGNRRLEFRPFSVEFGRVLLGPAGINRICLVSSCCTAQKPS